jgi:hypothetical protein
MTEAEWRTTTEPAKMLQFLEGKASDRKLRLLACAWCREVWYQLANNLCRQAVELSERAADDSSVLEDMAHVRDAARATSTDARGISHSGRKGAGYDAALCTAIGKMWHMRTVLESTQLLATRPGYRHLQCDVTRDIFGNPSRPVAVDPSWLTSTVVALAEGIYQERAFDRLPILADALMDAGCDSADLLDHCRSDGPHVRGCWVIDLLTGRK